MKPCTKVTFRHPAEWVTTEEDGGGVLAVGGAQWFAALLLCVSGLEIVHDLQEDWGVMLFAQRNGKKFWIGLSIWDEGYWIAHFHHNSFLQRLSSSGKNELNRLLADVHEVLASEAVISDIAWHEDPYKLQGRDFPTPVG